MAQSKNAKARKQSNKKKNRNRAAALMVSVLLVLVIGGAVYATGRSVQTVQIPRNVTIIIDGEDVSRLSEEKAIKLLEEKYPWNMTVVYGEHTKEVENQIAPEIQWVVQQAFQEAESVSAEEKSLTFWQRLTGSGKEAEPVVLQYELAMPDGADVAEALAWQLTSEWGDPAENAKITEYDTASGRFLVEEGKNGTEIDEEKLKEEIVAAVEERDFVRTITAPDKFVEPAIKASAFKVMSTYETTTTANQDRNTNVRLAAEAVCGTILQPGEQFSYNTVVGPRTAEKGYKQAAAYSDGQTVLEYGGGVCQVSSTLYNAVIGAGLRTDVRTGHTFEPSYVTPGQDATVSYAEPDFVFTNTSDATVGIRAVYNDRKMYVEFYGVPVLEEGVKRYMRSEKTSELDSPAPTYV
ncbi:MAG: VanW family protein, partial [Lachnospiraceae bacterium]|nr:VanW family protein [Lachnospiraceae bacterium]